MKTPETHTRYRVQKLIRMGEWLERNEAALVLAFDVLDDAHDKLCDPEETLNPNVLLDHVGHEQMQALQALRPMMMDLRWTHDWVLDWKVNKTDVTLHRPYQKCKYEVVIEAPKPVTDETPTKEEFNKTRSEVDV